MQETVTVSHTTPEISNAALDEALAQIQQTASLHFQTPHCSVLLVEARTGDLCGRMQTGCNRDAETICFRLGEGIAGAAAMLRDIVYAPDVARDARYIPTYAGTRSELAVPLMVNDEVVAVLDCQAERLDFFTAEKIEQLKLFCAPAALALQNAQRFSREQRRRSQVEAVNAVARETTSVFELDQLLDRLCEVILRNFAADQVSVVMYDDGYLTVAHFRGKLTSRLAQGERLPESAGLCARALANAAPVLDNRVRTNSGYVAGFEETHSEVCLPLISFSEPLGVLVLDSAKPDAFDPEEIHAMQAAADVCATAIQNARHFERARNLANVDGLTGIYNRRYFEQRILEELERSLRYNGSMALLMIDIDHFKKLNDEFGHLLGDEVLRQVSNIFEEHLRKLDVVCRYGGEEFAILVPETPGNRAMGVAEKLRKIIEGWNFPGVPRPVTISVGVAEFPTNGRTRDELMKAADDALYLAKQKGRNRVVAAQGTAADRNQLSLPNPA
jgi:diguanylate cyclase (GGDEF)-like protein